MTSSRERFGFFVLGLIESEETATALGAYVGRQFTLFSCVDLDIYFLQTLESFWCPLLSGIRCVYLSSLCKTENLEWSSVESHTSRAPESSPVRPFVGPNPEGPNFQRPPSRSAAGAAGAGPFFGLDISVSLRHPTRISSISSRLLLLFLYFLFNIQAGAR
jgi:hypothetical protein